METKQEKLLKEIHKDIKKLQQGIAYLVSLIVEKIEQTEEYEETEGSNEIETPELIREGLEMKKEIEQKEIIKPMNRHIR